MVCTRGAAVVQFASSFAAGKSLYTWMAQVPDMPARIGRIFTMNAPCGHCTMSEPLRCAYCCRSLASPCASISRSLHGFPCPFSGCHWARGCPVHAKLLVPFANFIESQYSGSVIAISLALAGLLLGCTVLTLPSLLSVLRLVHSVQCKVRDAPH